MIKGSMRILLLRCPMITISDYAPDIGLVNIASYLAQLGYDIAVFDINIELYQRSTQEHKAVWEHSNLHSFSEDKKELFSTYAKFWRDMYDRIIAFNPDVIGFNVWNSNAAMSLQYAKRLKEMLPQVKIIFGGPECYPLLSGMLFASEPCIDVVIYGEAELTAGRVLESMKKRSYFFHIPGIIVNNDGHIQDNGWGEYVRDLDMLPDMRLDLFPFALYPKLPLSFSRGCVHNCKYCPRGMYPRVRFRSVNRIFHEMKLLVMRYPKKSSLCVCDSSMTNNLKQLIDLSDCIIANGLSLDITGFASPNPALTPALLSRLKQAGFNSFCYGIETASEKLNKMYDKKVSIESMERVIRQTYEADINIAIDMMVGFPGESEEDFKVSMDFIARNRQYITGGIGINECENLPYSYLWDFPGEFSFIPQEIKRERHYKMKSFIDSLDISEAQKYNYTPRGQ